MCASTGRANYRECRSGVLRMNDGEQSTPWAFWPDRRAVCPPLRNSKGGLLVRDSVLVGCRAMLDVFAIGWRHILDTFYWTPGWGNVATVLAAVAAIVISGARHRFDKEEDRRTVQRETVAELLALLRVFTFDLSVYAKKATNARLIYVRSDLEWPTLNLSAEKYRNKVYQHAEGLIASRQDLEQAFQVSLLTLVSVDVEEAVGAGLEEFRAGLAQLALHNGHILQVVDSDSPTHAHKALAIERDCLAQIESASAGLYAASDAIGTTAFQNLRPQERRVFVRSRTTRAKR